MAPAQTLARLYQLDALILANSPDSPAIRPLCQERDKLEAELTELCRHPWNDVE